MKSKKPNTKRSRIALQLPRDLDDLIAEEAQLRLTSKSAIVRSILADWRKSQPVQQ